MVRDSYSKRQNHLCCYIVRHTGTKCYRSRSIVVNFSKLGCYEFFYTKKFLINQLNIFNRMVFFCLKRNNYSTVTRFFTFAKITNFFLISKFS